MPRDRWRGSVAIPMTPFDAQDRIDEAALRAELRFCIASHVGGIATPLMVSEFRLLSEEERRLMVRVAVEECRGSGIPVVANCAAVNTPLAVRYAEYAREVGADAVIAMPPYIHRPDWPTIRAYYQAISDAVDVPVWVQNASLAPLSAEQIVELCSEIDNVSWVKEEVPPSTHNISRLMAKRCPAVKGVMGGGGGRYLIAERARGAAGVIHACQFCDVVQRIWTLLDDGLQEAAEELYERLLPNLMLEGLMGMAYAKEIMVRRGVLRNNRIRTEARPLDDEDLREIDRAWQRIEPYLIWHAQ
ncbi:MAG: dihydrodipicolinate synthase family protein [Chloroflexi bacterium]|nr:dihydrodipicolinate synthase family protein [Chloroflexota bacterium]